MPTTRSVVIVALTTTLGHAAAPVVPVLAWVAAGVVLSTVVGAFGHTLATCVNVLLAPMAAAMSPTVAQGLLVVDPDYAAALAVIAVAIVTKAFIAALYVRLPWRLQVPTLWTRTDNADPDTTYPANTGKANENESCEMIETSKDIKTRNGVEVSDPTDDCTTPWDQIGDGMQLVAAGLRQAVIQFEQSNGLSQVQEQAAAGVAFNLKLAQDLAQQLEHLTMLTETHSKKYDIV